MRMIQPWQHGAIFELALPLCTGQYGRLVKPAEALAVHYKMGFWIQLLSPALLFASCKCGGWIAYRRFEQPLCVVFVVSESAEILYVCSEVSWAERLQH